MYKKVDTKLDFAAREPEVAKFWKDNKVIKKMIEKNKNGEMYTFYEGPPTANGKPHIGHVLTRTIKDVFLRYQTMKGKNILRKAGWDTHGLPVELEVEKMIGSTGKQDIEAYGIQPFIDNCRESVWKYKDMWEQFCDPYKPNLSCAFQKVPTIQIRYIRFYKLHKHHQYQQNNPFCLKTVPTYPYISKHFHGNYQ